MSKEELIFISIIYLIELIVILIFTIKNKEYKHTLISPLVALATTIATSGMLWAIMSFPIIIYKVSSNLPEILKKTGYGIYVISCICAMFGIPFLIIQIINNTLKYGYTKAFDDTIFQKFFIAHDLYKKERTVPHLESLVIISLLIIMFIIGTAGLINEFIINPN